MSPILTLGIRNLIRRPRRTILLGAAIALGAMVVVMAGSLAAGISDVLFNKVLILLTGHVNVSFADNGNAEKNVFHNRTLMLSRIRAAVPDAVSITEHLSGGVFGRVLANGKADYLGLASLEIKTGMSSRDIGQAGINLGIRMIDGSLAQMLDTAVENAVIIPAVKARYYGVKPGDRLSVRYRNLDGQDCAAHLTLAGVFEPMNSFMAKVIYLRFGDMRQLLGYGPEDLAPVDIFIKNPKKNARRVAQEVHRVLNPPVALINGLISHKGVSIKTRVTGYKTDSAGLAQMPSIIRSMSGDSGAFFNGQGVAFSADLASALGVSCGDTCDIAYQSGSGQNTIHWVLAINAIVTMRENNSGRFALINDKQFYNQYYRHWPATQASYDTIGLDTNGPLRRVLASEWRLKERNPGGGGGWRDQLLPRDIRRVPGTQVQVRSLYEIVAELVGLESSLGLITGIAILVLFFVVLIGVVTTLRITIRERSREIGAMRALGMRRGDVCNLFLLETFFLVFFSSIAGTICALLVMGVLSCVTFHPTNISMEMLLLNSHLPFVPRVTSLVVYNLLIIVIPLFAVWSPSRKAGMMDPAAALRHHE